MVRSAGMSAFLLTILFLLGGSSAAQKEGNIVSALVEGTDLVVLKPDGQRIEGGALIGAIVVGGDPELGSVAVRINGLRADPDDPEITLYDLSTRDAMTGHWKPACVPDNRGVSGGIFLAGSWNLRGTHLHDEKFSVSCTSAAIGKCVRAGYKPWKIASDGRTIWDYHQACVRTIRADYCGNGIGHTRNGVLINIIDRLSPEEPSSGLEFEAAWTPEGASCIARPRLRTSSLEQIVAICPERLRDRVGAACSMPEQLANPEVLLVNKSAPEKQ
jgi:hypothetical protein